MLDTNHHTSAAIVLFNQNPITLQKTIKAVQECEEINKLYLIDNSKVDCSSKYKNVNKIDYRFTEKNLGFGRAHNLIIDEIKNKFTHHLILNPDVVFNPRDISVLVCELEKNENVSMISPKANYPSGEIQYTCRKNPSFRELIYRRLKLKKTYLYQQEYRGLDLTKSFHPDFIHGFFMLFKTKDFIDIKGFDERYFLYLEDADICRKIYKNNKKVLYFPEVEVIHEHQRGSSKSIRLLIYHISSAIKYFKKWKN